jgi:hypothetical protein
MSLLDALRAIAQRTGAEIAVDATIKANDFVNVPSEIASISDAATALQRLLHDLPQHDWRHKAEKAFLVYKPITMSWRGEPLRQALADLSAAVEVPIIPDENVTGTLYADIHRLPLENALEIVLAGTPYVFKRMPAYYLVTDRAAPSFGLPEISATRVIRLRHTAPEQIKSLLSPAFGPYVKAEPADPCEPNNRGSIVTIAAPLSLADRIEANVHLVRDADEVA